MAFDDSYDGPLFDPMYDTFGVNLERVELVGCMFDSKEFSNFIEQMSQLKTLKLVYQTKWHGTIFDCRDAGEIVPILMAATGSTLEILSLFNLDYGFQVLTGVADMTGFKKLRELELGTEWLIDFPYFLNLEVPRFVDLLPPSIEKLVLPTGMSALAMKCLQSLFTDFIVEKDTKLPNLTKVTIFGEFMGDDGPSLPDVLSLALDVAHVKLINEDRSYQVEFLEDFADRFGVHVDTFKQKGILAGGPGLSPTYNR